MDAFYASVEQRDNPDYKGKPLIVGGARERGVVSAASYEARKFGIKSAMPVKTAFRLCPELIAVPPRMEHYRTVSNQIRSVFHEYTNLVEPLSLDEAFLDVTKVKNGPPSATLIAEEIRKKIKHKTGLTASAGVSINKFLAKVASDINKPNGIFVITPDKALDFIEKLPIEKFFGVGKVTGEKMKKIGVYNGNTLKQIPLYELQKKFGKQGLHFYNIARGIDEREVEPERIRKSVGAEKTFDKDIQNFEELNNNINQISEKLFERIINNKYEGKTLTLKLKFSDFIQITRSKTSSSDFIKATEIKKRALELLKEFRNMEKSVRLAGISISNSNKTDNERDVIQLTIDF